MSLIGRSPLHHMRLFLASVAATCIAVTGPVFAEPLKVSVLRVEVRPTESIFALTGEIVPRKEINIAFPTGGRLLSVEVDRGDRVGKGDVLARLAAVQQEQTQRAAEAALEAALADLEQAKADFDRQEKLLTAGSTTRLVRDEAERHYLIAQASRKRADATLERARKSVRDTVIRAPAGGTITDRLADAGEVVGAARTIFKLAAGSALDARFYAPDSIPADVPASLPVTLALINSPGETFTGYIREISPLVDPASGTVEVKVSVDAVSGRIGLGDVVRAQVVRTFPAAVLVPYSAISAVGAGEGVWVIDPETRTVTMRPVRVRLFLDDQVVIGDGLETGEIVVVKGAHLLFPGRKVTFEEND